MWFISLRAPVELTRSGHATEKCLVSTKSQTRFCPELLSHCNAACIIITINFVLKVFFAVIVRFEQSGYSSSEGISDEDLALQICLIVQDSPSTFDVELFVDGSNEDGSYSVSFELVFLSVPLLKSIQTLRSFHVW